MSSNEERRVRMVRAELSDEEWKALRVVAVRRGVSVQALVSELLREAAAGELGAEPA